MKNNTNKAPALLTACALALGVSVPVASQQATEIVEEIVVTGSLIAGTPEDSAIPVDTITSEELELQGNPSALEQIKGLSYMNGIVGESNQFTGGRGQAAQGSASINLRGLGSARTLVLLNGKRLSSEDANRIPTAAIGRTEVLKDGGAVTYGSDAIAGVVNFVTKTNVEGFELSGDYRSIQDSDGDYNLGMSWGMVTDNSDLFTSFNYFHRSELAMSDRDWGVVPYLENPEGGWATGANPGAFGSTATFVDPACEIMGGVLTDAAGNLDPAGNRCRTQYTGWDNFVEEQDSYQFFTGYNLEMGNHKLHLEALYANTTVDHANTTPGYTTANSVPATLLPFPSANALNPFYYIPASNPGLQDIALQAGYFPGVATVAILNRWRPFFSGGNPLYGNGEGWTEYERSQYRLSAELEGSFTDNIGYTTSLTYGQAEDIRRENDVRIDRLQRALLGLGGPNCTGATPGANGCVYFNPFSSAYAVNPLTGVSNPYYEPLLTNSPALVDWMMDQHETTGTATNVEFNFLVDGQTNFELPGGALGWAAGVQYRMQRDEREYSDFNNQLLNPCPLYGDTSCSDAVRGASPYIFLATYTPYDLDREIVSAFGQVDMPILDNLNVSIAARYEDYGNVGGDSFDPSIRVKWQAADWLGFRVSAGTAFRAAPLASLSPNGGTAFAFVQGNSTPIVTTGNPDLEPEESTNYNVGVIFSGDNFDLNIDYWRFDIDKILTAEPISGIVAGVEACNPYFLTYVDLSGPCTVAPGGGTIDRITRSTINGAGVMNDGIDIQGQYTWDDVASGSLSLGGSATRILHFETETLTINGVVFEEGFDGAGYYNGDTTLFPLPKWRGNVFLNYAFGSQNIRWTVRYIDSYEDQRSSVDFVNIPDGQTIDSTVTHHISYGWDVNDSLTLSGVIDNLTDEDPSFARTEINYDAVTGNPLGRTIKVGAKYRF